jgi:hypothetical protein
MTYLVPAQAGAQFISLFVYALIAKWYVAPWLGGLKRADAIIALLWVHVFRYVALMTFSAQRDGFPISDDGLFDIVIGDVAGATIALLAIFALRYHARLGIALAWLLAAETIFDTVTNIRGGVREHLMGAAAHDLADSGLLRAFDHCQRRGPALAAFHAAWRSARPGHS